jgi:GNAT superfamily N-acetyltransferase
VILDEHEIAELVKIEYAAGRLFTDLGMVFPPHDPAEVLRNAAVVLTVGEPRIGFAVVGELGPDAYLEQISVHPDHGRRGVGTALLMTALDWARAGDHPRMVLTTFRDLPWNGPWYAHHGFRELPYDECSAELRAVRDAELEAGLDAMAPRVAMAHDLT